MLGLTSFHCALPFSVARRVNHGHAHLLLKCWDTWHTAVSSTVQETVRVKSVLGTDQYESGSRDEALL